MKGKALAIMMIGLMFMVSIPSPSTGAPVTETGEIESGRYENVFLGAASATADRSVKIKVTSNSSIDVYIILEEDFIPYPETFSPIKAFERTTNADFSFTSKAREEYRVIIDNLDNSRSSDAVPTGNVTYTVTYPNPFEEITGNVQTFAWTCIGVIVAVVIVVIVIIVVLVKVFSKKKKPPARPYQAHGQPYQQQHHQPPPPSPYQPPPPSPYEPPPPQPPSY